NPIRNVEHDASVKKENIVLTVGRLIPTKHVDQLIEIFTEIDKSGWKLVIVGGDAKRMTLSEELDALITELGVRDSVLLEGQQKDVDRYYNRSKIFAFTSSSEGFPNVIGEALSAGLPVITYDCVAGPSDMVEDERNGFLIPLFNKELFKEKLSLLMEDEALRLQMSDAAKNSIKKYSNSLVSNKFFKFINNT
ncbi:MAG: glycosyltransferase, partial [Pseudomonadota bacterium]|nr:glycosyltransferase [Pseudomonadota bacterium]